MLLTVEGPPALERLDAVEVEIRGDGYTHLANLAGGPTQERIDETIWGPYRFKPVIDGASSNERMVPAVPVELGGWIKYALEESFAPAWSHGSSWRERYAGEAVYPLPA